MRQQIPFERINNSLTSEWHLTSLEAKSRLIEFGPNDIVEIPQNRLLEIAIDVAKDPMLWFLIGCSALFALLKNYNQSLILLMATVPLLSMDAFLHWRTTNATRLLKSYLAASAIAIRDGIEITLRVSDLVPGDLVVVKLGTAFPADGLIVDGLDIQVDESALTGEAMPVIKKPLNKIDQNKITIDDQQWGFAGTVLLTGQAILRVAYTGQQTIYGEIITSTVITTHQQTPLQKALARLILTLIIFATILCFVLAISRYLQGFGIIDALLSAAVLAVAALPDEFPVVFTFFLGLGVFRLAQKNALVRRAVSIENIGRVTTICSDKTGTITEGKLQLLNIIPNQENESSMIKLAAIASRIQSGDPLDLAIHKKSANYNIMLPKIITTFPFSEERLRETALVKEENNCLFATKGAPEKILSISTLSPEEIQYWQDQVTSNAKMGYKVIAIAYKMHKKLQPNTEPNDGYKFAGLLVFYDPIRPGVKTSVAKCLSSGIHVLVITGDHPETARTVAKELGLGQGKPNVMLASEAYIKADLSNENFYKSIDVIARAIPSQKLYIVNSLQKHGEIVAVTGDGVNDVPALKAADIGIAMGQSGSQGAREAAKIVLLDDNFTSIVNAISEGRQLFKNLQLSFKYLLMIHIPFIFSAAIIPLVGYPLLFQPINIIIIELIIHPTCMLVFQDLPANDKLEQVQRTSKIIFFSSRDWFGIIVVGIFATAVIVIGYANMLNLTKDTEHARAFSLGFLGVISAAITIGLSNLRTIVSRIISIFTIVITMASIQIPWLAKIFEVTPLHQSDWAIILLAGSIVLLLSKI